jgi:hypothetical protein
MSVISMTEHEWEARKQSYRSRLTTIVIPLDITPGVAKGLLSRIERAKAIGGNEIARKKAATEAIQNYPVDGDETINLYEVQRQLTERLSYVSGVIDVLNGKQSRLITTTGLLKLEKELSPHADSGWDAGKT